MASIDSIQVGSTTYDIAAKSLSGGVSIDGVDFDGSANIIHYGTCSTEAATAAKTVACTGFKLVTGARIAVKFTNSNSSTSPTLNVNSTNAKSIKKYGTTAPTTYMWYPGAVVEFVYDGTNWIMLGGTTATTTYYGVTKLNDTFSSNSVTEAATANAVRVAYSLANGKQSPATTLAGYGITDAYTKAETDAIVDSIMQGGVPYGKELSDSWAALRTKVQAGNFDGIRIGDYKTITLTTNEKVVMEVAGIDTYYKTYTSSIGHHIDFISRDCLAGAKQMNSTDTNNGTAAEPNPWRSSELFQAMNHENSGVYSTLPADLKAVIIEKQALLERRYSAGGTVSADTGWGWGSRGKLWLPTEVEVFGYQSWSEPGFGTGNGVQYPIFYGGYKHIIKGGGNGGGRTTWWAASAHRANSVHFCDVSGHGDAGYNAASNTTHRVPLCFRIG